MAGAITLRLSFCGRSMSMIRLLLCTAALAASHFTLGGDLDRDEHVNQLKSGNRRAANNESDLKFALRVIKG